MSKIIDFEALMRDQMTVTSGRINPSTVKMLIDMGFRITKEKPIFDEEKERQLFEDSMIEASEEAGFGEPDLYRDSGGCYRQTYHQAAWGGWLACAQYRAKAGEVGHE